MGKSWPVLSTVILRLEQVMPCYAAAERVHPSVRAKQVADRVNGELEGVDVSWIAAWKEDVCKAAVERWKILLFAGRMRQVCRRCFARSASTPRCPAV